MQHRKEKVGQDQTQFLGNYSLKQRGLNPAAFGINIYKCTYVLYLMNLLELAKIGGFAAIFARSGSQVEKRCALSILILVGCHYFSITPLATLLVHQGNILRPS